MIPMNNLFKVLVTLPAILFIVMGIRWLVDPAGIAPEFGFALAEGLGRSSQIGDMSGYFLTGGICMLLGVVSGQRIWYYPPMIMLSLTALGRVLAWLVHDASFAADKIAPEVIISLILLVAATRLRKESQ